MILELFIVWVYRCCFRNHWVSLQRKKSVSTSSSLHDIYLLIPTPIDPLLPRSVYIIAYQFSPPDRRLLYLGSYMAPDWLNLFTTHD